MSGKATVIFDHLFFIPWDAANELGLFYPILYTFISAFGSWFFIVICGAVMLFSHFHFDKAFSHPFWKCAFIFIVGTYSVIFSVFSSVITAMAFARHGADVFIGEEIMGYFFIQFFCGVVILLFTIAYLLAFICRLVKSRRNKKKRREEDISCHTSR